MIHPLILKQKGSILTISGEILQQLLAKPKPILWCNDGLYGVVPIERVKNAVTVLEDEQKIFPNAIAGNLKLTWSEVVEIPQSTGRAMEKYNGGSGDKNSNKNSN